MIDHSGKLKMKCIMIATIEEGSSLSLELIINVNVSLCLIDFKECFIIQDYQFCSVYLILIVMY